LISCYISSVHEHCFIYETIMNKDTASLPGAPALLKGINVLQMLDDGKPYLFSAIAKATMIPKASLTRILRTLCSIGLVRRDPRTRAFLATSRLVPLSENRLDRDTLVFDTLFSLANTTGHTAEWYIPASDRLILTHRQEPRNAEVSIRAHIGFTRALEGELEAVSIIGNAFFSDSLPRHAWAYVKNGVRGKLSMAETKKRIALARKKEAVADSLCNSNGIRRLACVVRCGTEAIGILALAEFVPPSAAKQSAALLGTVNEHAQNLSKQFTANK